MTMLINAYCTVVNPPALDFPHQLLGRRTSEQPELVSHIDGFVGFLLSRRGEQMTAKLYHCIQHVQRVRTHISFEIEPDQLDGLTAWAEQANAILFLADSSIRDPWGRIVIAADGDSVSTDGEVPFPPEAYARRERTQSLLATMGVRIPLLPPVVSERELKLRPARDVALRAVALLLVALQAEALASESGSMAERLHKGFPQGYAALSPLEAQFMGEEKPARQDMINFCWRYEALQLLVWALGLLDALPSPAGICDVARLVDQLLALGEEEILAARLRSDAEILDALDLHYCLHWLVVQARLDGHEAPAGIDPGVINERHYALNWLTCFLDEDWDEVETPT